MSTDDSLDQETLAAALARFDADLERTHGHRSGASLSWEPGEVGEGWEQPVVGRWILAYAGTERAWEIGFDVLDVIDDLQDDVIETLRAAWPECPWHRSHPLRIIEQEGDYWWECPSEPGHSVALGRVGLDP